MSTVIQSWDTLDKGQMVSVNGEHLAEVVMAGIKPDIHNRLTEHPRICTSKYYALVKFYDGACFTVYSDAVNLSTPKAD